MIVLKAILGVFFAVGVIAAAIVVAAFIIRTVLILWDMAMGETRRVMRDVRRGRIV